MHPTLLKHSAWLQPYSTHKLDPIQKKSLSSPQVLYPLENAPIEWWYFSGHLHTKASTQEFGYEFCIFKFHPVALAHHALPQFSARPILVLHLALIDTKNKTFWFTQTIPLTYQIKKSKLNISFDHTSLTLNKTFHLKTNHEISFDLQLKPLKKLIKQYNHGFEIMYNKPQHRTYYVTYPRLATRGTIKKDNHTYRVHGQSWFDHQKMNLPKNSPLHGWDWFSIMFDDFTELMLFVLKSKRGVLHQHMGGTYITKSGRTISLKPKDIQIKPLTYWQSPKTNITYPSTWHCTIPSLSLTFTITPLILNQELYNKKFNPLTYWEGACIVKGTKSHKPLHGKSYVELVGYDQRWHTTLLHKVFSSI